MSGSQYYTKAMKNAFIHSHECRWVLHRRELGLTPVTPDQHEDETFTHIIGRLKSFGSRLRDAAWTYGTRSVQEATPLRSFVPILPT